MLFRQLFDAESSTYSYLLADEDTREAVLIDPVLEQVDRDVGLIRELGLTLRYALDTHVHADHVTGAAKLREQLGCETVLSAQAGVGCADVLARHGDVIRFGRCGLEVLETPGHTASCLSYVTLDRAMVFTGDALLIRGCGRTDFQSGDARQLFRSIRDQLFALPPTTLVYPGHDYQGHTASSIDEERRHNPRVGEPRSEAEFLEIMANLRLAYPKKIDVALPLNLRCGTAFQAAEPRGLAEPELASWSPVANADGILEVDPGWVAAHQAELRILDVREPAELSSELGHIAGAERVPLGQLSATPIEADTRAVITVCHSGRRSAQAVRVLEAARLPRLASMKGGMVAWRQAGLPVVR